MRCQIQGCNNRGVAKNLCDKHRKRLARHGHLEQTRPKDWGKREKHPLYKTWQWFHSRVQGGIADEWKDFWAFVEGVGERPPGHRLYRIDTSRPIGPDNFFWKEAGKEDGSKAAQARRWRREHPLEAKNADLKRDFGITIEDYFAMLDAQGGGCAICGRADNGRYKYLSVDHCHDTEQIRGLLCSPCNRGIGMFRDDPDLLAKAISYLASDNGRNRRLLTSEETWNDGSS